MVPCRAVQWEPLQEAAGRAALSESKLFRNNIFQVTCYLPKLGGGREHAWRYT